MKATTQWLIAVLLNIACKWNVEVVALSKKHEQHSILVGAPRKQRRRRRLQQQWGTSYGTGQFPIQQNNNLGGGRLSWEAYSGTVYDSLTTGKKGSKSKSSSTQYDFSALSSVSGAKKAKSKKPTNNYDNGKSVYDSFYDEFDCGHDNCDGLNDFLVGLTDEEFVEDSCEAIASGRPVFVPSNVKYDELSYSAAIHLVVSDSIPITMILNDLQQALQERVAPAVAGCNTSGNRNRNRMLANGGDPVILNVAFEVDPSSSTQKVCNISPALTLQYAESRYEGNLMCFSADSSIFVVLLERNFLNDDFVEILKAQIARTELDVKGLVDITTVDIVELQNNNPRSDLTITRAESVPLSRSAIAGIAVACIMVLICIISLFVAIIRCRRQENDELDDELKPFGSCDAQNDHGNPPPIFRKGSDATTLLCMSYSGEGSPADRAEEIPGEMTPSNMLRWGGTHQMAEELKATSKLASNEWTYKQTQESSDENSYETATNEESPGPCDEVDGERSTNPVQLVQAMCEDSINIVQSISPKVEDTVSF